MTDEDLTPYEERMIELKEEEVAQLRGIRKELRAGSRAKKLHYLLDELDVDRDDLEAVFRILKSKFGEMQSPEPDEGIEVAEEDEAAVEVSAGGDTDEIRRAVADAIASATGKNVSVEIEEE